MDHLITYSTVALMSAVAVVLTMHQPVTPPESHNWVSGEDTPHCATCDGGGDPFNAELWPCPTYTAVMNALQEEEA